MARNALRCELRAEHEPHGGAEAIGRERTQEIETGDRRFEILREARRASDPQQVAAERLIKKAQPVDVEAIARRGDHVIGPEGQRALLGVLELKLHLAAYDRR